MVIWFRGYKTFFILNSAEHEILNGHRYESIRKFSIFSGSETPKMLFFFIPEMLKCIQMLFFLSQKCLNAYNCWHLTFMNRKKFMLS